MALKIFKIKDNKIIRVSKRVDKIFKNLFRSKKLKNKKFGNPIYIKAAKKSIFLNLNAKKVFIYLRQAYIKTLIF